MKRYLIIFILFLLAGNLPAKADYIATHTFVVDAENTITVVVSGFLNAAIDGDTGALSSPLSINFNIATNEDLDNIRLRALVLDADSNKDGAFYCTGTEDVASQAMHLVLGATAHPPSLVAVNNCEQAASDPLINDGVVAYPGTVSINHGGTVRYSNADKYFNAQVKSGTSDLTLALGTTPKAGTFDSASAMDEPDDYKVEVYLDNIP